MRLWEWWLSGFVGGGVCWLFTKCIAKSTDLSGIDLRCGLPPNNTPPVCFHKRNAFPENTPRILRKEVIQPHLPIRLPCYDFVPLAPRTFDGSLLAVEPPASGADNSGDVTGGVYKARERIHRRFADRRLLAIPTSCSRVADCNLNWERIFGIASTSRARFPLSAVHCSMFVAQDVRAMLT